MHRYAEDARAGDAGDFAELDEAERRAVAHEGIDRDASRARCAQGGDDVALDYFAGEIVKGVVTIPPSGMADCVSLQRVPERAAAVADDYDRACQRIDRR